MNDYFRIYGLIPPVEGPQESSVENSIKSLCHQNLASTRNFEDALTIKNSLSKKYENVIIIQGL